MTSLLLAQLDLEALESGISLDDVVELAAIEKDEGAFDEICLSVLSHQMSSSVREKLCGELDVRSEHFYTFHRVSGFEFGNTMLGNAMAFLSGHSKLAIYDCNRAERTELIDLGSATGSKSELFRILAKLDLSYSERKLNESILLLKNVVSLTRRKESDVGVRLRGVVQPPLRFFQTYCDLLSKAMSEVGYGGGFSSYGSLKSVHFGDLIDRLSGMQTELGNEVRELDSIQMAASFFRYGSRCIGALRRPSGRANREESYVRLLIWFCSYFLAASKEAANNSQLNQALLYAFRGLEAYVSAQLGASQRIEFKSDGTFLLDDRPLRGFQRAWDAFLELVPSDFVGTFGNSIDDLRTHRNGNVLIHGFGVASDRNVGDARSSIKGLIAYVSGLEPEANRLVRGPVADFLVGEKWKESFGRAIVGCLVGDLQSIS